MSSSLNSPLNFNLEVNEKDLSKAESGKIELTQGIQEGLKEGFIDNQNAKRSLFSNNVISSHFIGFLSELGYPQKSIESMEKCGKSNGFKVLGSCYCRNVIYPMTYNCSLRTCPRCAKIRKRRVVNRYKPFLESLYQDKEYFLYFLTISPQNYENLEEGIEHTKKSFSKFLRHNYIKGRIKAGLYVIETKGTEGNWNIHIHAIVYGKWIDNKIRGKCLDCGQNLLKYDYETKTFSCSNQKCNSKNVVHKKNSKLVDLFRQSSGREVNINIQKQSSTSYTLNYLCKYIAVNKDDFSNEKDLARYIVFTRKRRLINTFGLFFKCDIPKNKGICPNCKGEIHYCMDNEVCNQILNEREKRAFEERNPPPFIIKELDIWF